MGGCFRRVICDIINLMIKKIFKISLFFGIFSLFLFRASFCSAVSAPTGLTPCGGTQPLSVLLNWGDESVHHYELYYKRTEETNWTDRYPSISQCQVAGLSPAKDYEWYVVSCGNPECSDRAPSGICSFATQGIAPPDGDGDGDGGDGSPITNPLQVNTLGEALDALFNFLFILTLALAPILIIYAAYLILTAAGDAVKINKARQVILWTVIAIAIVLFAKGLPALIKGALGG